jgi:hypothetical protein
VTLVSPSLRDYGITMVSPLLTDTSPQAKAGAGFDRASFHVDFDAQQARCPQGKLSSSWSPCTQRGTAAIVVKFDTATTTPCPVRDQCTTATAVDGNSPCHHVSSTRPRPPPAPSRTPTNWQTRYAIRAGVEDTIGQAVTITGTRRARYRGLHKTHLEHVFSATALNLIRLDAWCNGHPLDHTPNQPPRSPRVRPSRIKA